MSVTSGKNCGATATSPIGEEAKCELTALLINVTVSPWHRTLRNRGKNGWTMVLPAEHFLG